MVGKRGESISLCSHHVGSFGVDGRGLYSEIANNICCQIYKNEGDAEQMRVTAES